MLTDKIWVGKLDTVLTNDKQKKGAESMSPLDLQMMCMCSSLQVRTDMVSVGNFEVH